jgi:hypothetical protein
MIQQSEVVSLEDDTTIRGGLSLRNCISRIEFAKLSRDLEETFIMIDVRFGRDFEEWTTPFGGQGLALLLTHFAS